MNEATTTTDSTAGKIVCTQCGRASNNASWLEGEGPFCGICAAIWRNRILGSFPLPQRFDYIPLPSWPESPWPWDRYWYGIHTGARQ